MKSFLLTIVIFLQFFIATAQIAIQGSIKDESGLPLVGANILIKGTYLGATSDKNGNYSFTVPSKDTIHLIVSFLGYETVEKVYVNEKKIEDNIILELVTDELDAVVITAGTFSAGDKKRAGKLDPLDIVTTANAEADVYAALSTLPGAQQLGESGKLIVRGGESYETRTYIDGLLVSSPYTSSMPDMPARGRFSPFLFSGVTFSTGGYSAEYGQALSSVVVLNTNALADEDLTSISIMNVGIGASHTNRTKNASYTLEGNYMNTWPYFQMAQHSIDWVRYPESINANGRYRLKTGENGMLKIFVNYDNSLSAMDEANQFSGKVDRISLHDKNLLSKISYATTLNEKWMIKAGLAYNSDKEDLDYNADNILKEVQSTHLRLGLTNYTTDKFTLKTGFENYYMEHDESISLTDEGLNYLAFLADNLFATFLESDIRLSEKFAFRLGGRMEYSSVIKRLNVVPRASLAFKTTDYSQISVAYGRFMQNPVADYLIYSRSLQFEESKHYVLNYQYEKDKRLLRMELFQKSYLHLVKYDLGEYSEFTNLNNDGEGYARGFDLFWRDRKTITFLDYWISYSYTDTKRNYKNYPKLAIPEFVSKHNLSIVTKYWLEKFRTQLSISYNFSSGRPYYNPESSEYNSDLTKPYNDISGSLSYLTNLFGKFTVVYLSCTNLLGLDNVYGYQYSSEPDSSGNYARYAIKPYAKRTFIAGLFISIK